MDDINLMSDWEQQAEDETFDLRLFVAGTSPVSIRAINNLKSILDEYSSGQYNLEIIDAHQQPTLARDENITALPMLIKKAPNPKRLLVGDMSDRSKVLRGLGINQ
ncbi:circadian clock KaiB family protein [Mucilaginibacter conchicola]|nr:circadian clock KaiB family protein [Mucilaginibacter conchicola]